MSTLGDHQPVHFVTVRHLSLHFSEFPRCSDYVFNGGRPAPLLGARGAIIALEAHALVVERSYRCGTAIASRACCASDCIMPAQGLQRLQAAARRCSLPGGRITQLRRIDYQFIDHRELFSHNDRRSA